MNSEEIKQQIEELEKVRLHTRRFRLITLLAVLTIVIAGVSAIINSLYSLALEGPKREAFVTKLNNNMRNDLLPIVERIVGRTAKQLKPAIDIEVQRVNERAPAVAQVAFNELEELGLELTTAAGQILDKTITGMLKKREGKLRVMYPDIYDKEIDSLLSNLALEAEDQLAQCGESLFNSHLNSIQSILINLDKIKKTEPPEIGENLDSWQVAFMFMDVFVSEFNNMTPAEVVELKPSKSNVQHNNSKPLKK